jgi:hypothetical protein
MRAGGANRAEQVLIKLKFENVTIEKEYGAKGLVLRGGGDIFLRDQVGDEGINFGRTHFAWVSLVVEEDIQPNPFEIGFFSAGGVLFGS